MKWRKFFQLLDACSIKLVIAFTGIVAFIVFFNSTRVLANIYAYKDEQGVMHYSNSPGTDSRYNLLYAIPKVGKSQANEAVQVKQTYRGPNDVDLPPLEKRKVIGTWLTKAIDGSCTRSFEVVNKKVYRVGRCSDGSGGKTGQEITQVSAKKFLSPTSTTGDYYVILENGDLSIRDKDGENTIEPKHVGVFPTAQSKPVPQSKIENSKTVGLTCYDIGYRSGNSAASSMKGKHIDPASDFAVPERCKIGSEINPDAVRGISAGTRAAW
jgi:hypothetical protein